MKFSEKINAGIIGFGRMGRLYAREMQDSGLWNISYICDISDSNLSDARTLCPDAKLIKEPTEFFADNNLQVVVLTALADSRPDAIRRAVKAGKHIISEKPLAQTSAIEWEMVNLLENSDLLSTVNLPLRNAWYNKETMDFIDSGEIGELAIIRICHMTPGLAPGEGHLPEGPCFHDCGLHYVDLARWMAKSEYHSYHAQGVRMWNYPQPWWLQAHGTFKNGITFDITQGHNYGQLAKDLTHVSYNDLIGTKGIIRLYHDFKIATLEMHGVNETKIIKQKYGDKNVDILCRLFAESIRQGHLHKDLPRLRDAATASDVAWQFLEDAASHDQPAIGSLSTLDEIIYRREHLKDGYGLLRKNKN